MICSRSFRHGITIETRGGAPTVSPGVSQPFLITPKKWARSSGIASRREHPSQDRNAKRRVMGGASVTRRSFTEQPGNRLRISPLPTPRTSGFRGLLRKSRTKGSGRRV
jgi:hypothetical protein